MKLRGALGIILCCMTATGMHAQESPAFFRVLSPTAAGITALDSNGILVWSNATVGVTSQLQKASALTASNAWADYVQAPVTSVVMELRVFDPSPPSGMVLVPCGMNSGVDPDAGAYSLVADTLYMDRAHVTRAQWEEVRTWAETNGYTDLPFAATNTMEYPIDSITWYDAVKWCNARSEKEGRPACSRVSGGIYRTGESSAVTCDFSVNGYRLATAQEWEYAARGGLRGKRYPWGNDISPARANYEQNVDDTTIAGTYPANGYGLFDMAGNLWDWVWDWHPSGVNQFRMICGGSWLDSAVQCRCAHRGFSQPGIPYYGFGVRAVMPAPPLGIAGDIMRAP